ncbi:YpmS family protein [Virgibacillus siamensis]|uniref:YpmS family protein n=1 Tax=Virgibacillus siamensis TaxID=480071 RepID=UPI0009844DC0|nr:YpmS family protein [Virgibacillus siamensis]
MAERRKRKNNWKRLFFMLFGLNLIIFIAIIALIFWPVSETENPNQENEITQQSSEFIVRTTKQNLNKLVNAYIDKLLEGSNHHYKVTLKDDVHLQGELPVFSTSVPLSMHLEPFVQENGDVILKQKSISIGLLQLPNQKIMEYMKKYLPVPKWVAINPEDEEIYVAVTDMKIKSNFQVGVEHIDLGANNLAFKIKIPYQTLGIEPKEE